MTKFKSLLSITLLVAVSISIVFNFGGCSKEMSPLFPNRKELQQNSNLNKRTTDQITFLKAKTIRLKKVFSVNQLITAANGGTIEVGDDTTGISSISFDPGDLSQDLSVDFWWDSQTFTAEFGPHGATFSDTVIIRLSYKDADLGGVSEDDLRIWYYDETDQLWEMTGRIVNKTAKYVEGKTTHFSRYAIGGE